MASLTAIFGNSETDEIESEKLLELYWNRAELKKEFARLRDEKFELEKRIEEHQGAEARLEQKYESLESLLLDPEWVYSVVVHYQLRALNESLKRKVMRFAEQLKQQQEKHEHRRLMQAWEDEKNAEIEEISALISEQRRQVQTLEQNLMGVRQRFAEMGAIARFFKKRGVTRELDEIVATIEVHQAEENKLLDAIEEIKAREAPDTQGLTIGQKRSINFMILSFVQHIYLHFEADNLAPMAKEAGDKSVGAIRYGTKEECDRLLGRFRDRAATFDSSGDFASTLKMRAKLLAETANFREDDQVLPIPNTVATLYRIAGGQVVDQKDRNLLGENYWAIGDAVSR